MPKPATPTIHLTTPLNATKGNAGKISLAYKVYEKKIREIMQYYNLYILQERKIV